MEEFGFKNLLFIRGYFFHRLFRRGIGLLFNWHPRAKTMTKQIQRFFIWIDSILSKSQFMKKNQIELIWGFEK
jgi:hypothetical protein